jgi:hypothetical protein
MAKNSSRKSNHLKKKRKTKREIPIPAHAGEEIWLQQKRDAANRQAGNDDFWRNVFGRSASDMSVFLAAEPAARGNEEINAKGTRRVARRGKKRRGTKRRGPKRR